MTSELICTLLHPSHTHSTFFVQNLSCHIVTSICGSDNPREAAMTAGIFYVLCACPIRSQPMILGSVGKEQRWIVGWQHCRPVVPPRISYVAPQVKDVTTLVHNLDIFNFFFRTWLDHSFRFKYFLKLN